VSDQELAGLTTPTLEGTSVQMPSGPVSGEVPHGEAPSLQLLGEAALAGRLRFWYVGR
jgi:hypothetical protein